MHADPRDKAWIASRREECADWIYARSMRVVLSLDIKITFQGEHPLQLGVRPDGETQRKVMMDRLNFLMDRRLVRPLCERHCTR